MADRRVLILLLMASAAAVATTSVLLLGLGAAQLILPLHVSDCWIWLLAAVGGGACLAPMRRRKHLPSLGLTATHLAVLGMSVFWIAGTPWVWCAYAAATATGIAGVYVASDVRFLLMKAAGQSHAATVMACWATVSSGSAALAALAEGSLFLTLGVRWVGTLITLLAMMPLAAIIYSPRISRRSLSHYIDDSNARH